ncbi:methylated-DNA--[protein]-cysteine S-methyltransferase [Marinicella meishanensis]|uniref:methylated-DNA--[protein]-cysteine S-methyltransferase n=1 Tax=Marinicella meishanensis TaxID=2873263 RepID=UPI001CC1A337|nr:methylated-DNA--[protein]-cysteine S-methyltransferase [Marinicella sp. NBU2979]
MTLYTDHLTTDLGLVEITADDQGIHSVYFVDQAQAVQANALTNRAKSQLREYFAGQRQSFDLPLAPQGTEFQQRVWQALLTIPYGQLASYRDMAQQLQQPKAVRAVGAANGKNPISIIVPCHRVIGANGSLTGYAGGLERKRWLLQHESSDLFKT